MAMPSSTRWGSLSSTARSMKAPGSPSSALQMTYFCCSPVLATVLHFKPVGYPAPPRPRSGLRGRGGAGYPTGLKWSTVAKTGEQQKYVICNADEGDPGAFMDRAVLESDPHRVLEGMAIAAYAVGAQKGYIYVRAEYPLAVKHLKTAIKQAERMGILGISISGTRFSSHIDIRLG